MFIPSKDPEAPHMRHLTDPRVRLIATMDIGNECAGFKPPGHWYSTTPTTDTVHPPMHIIAIATSSGATTHLVPHSLADFACTVNIQLIIARDCPALVSNASPTAPSIPRLAIKTMVVEGGTTQPVTQSIINKHSTHTPTLHIPPQK